MPPCTCIICPFCPYFAGAQAKRKRSFQTNWQCLASFRTIRAPISDLKADLEDIPTDLTDLWSKGRAEDAMNAQWPGQWTMAKHVHASHNVSACMKHDKVEWRNALASVNNGKGQGVESENAFPLLYRTLVKSLRSGYHYYSGSDRKMHSNTTSHWICRLLLKLPSWTLLFTDVHFDCFPDHFRFVRRKL